MSSQEKLNKVILAKYAGDIRFIQYDNTLDFKSSVKLLEICQRKTYECYDYIRLYFASENISLTEDDLTLMLSIFNEKFDMHNYEQNDDYNLKMKTITKINFWKIINPNILINQKIDLNDFNSFNSYISRTELNTFIIVEILKYIGRPFLEKIIEYWNSNKHIYDEEKNKQLEFINDNIEKFINEWQIRNIIE